MDPLLRELDLICYTLSWMVTNYQAYARVTYCCLLCALLAGLSFLTGADRRIADGRRDLRVVEIEV